MRRRAAALCPPLLVCEKTRYFAAAGGKSYWDSATAKRRKAYQRWFDGHVPIVLSISAQKNRLVCTYMPAIVMNDAEIVSQELA